MRVLWVGGEPRQTVGPTLPGARSRTLQKRPNECCGFRAHPPTRSGGELVVLRFGTVRRYHAWRTRSAICLFRKSIFRGLASSRAHRILCHLCSCPRSRQYEQRRTIPSGWIQVLRGPRPLSQQWPSSKRRVTSVVESPAQRQQRTPPPIPPSHAQNRQPARAPEVRVHRSPDEVAAAAQQRVQSLEAALHTLGDEDTPEVKSLQDALKNSKVQPRAVGRVPEVCCKMREAYCCIGCGTEGIGTSGGRKIKSGASPTDYGQPASRTSRFIIRSETIVKTSGRFVAAIARCGCTTLREASGGASQGTDSSIAGGLRAHARFRDRPMDARPSSRPPRRQPHGECERSHEVVPRDSRDSIRHGPIFRIAFHGDEFHQDGQ